MILIQDHFVVDEDGGAVCAELILEGAQFFRPDLLSLEVVAEESVAAEEGVDSLSITRWDSDRRATRLVEQLKPGGRMVLPVGPRWMGQELLILDKDSTGTTTTKKTIPVRFVPMIHGEN